MFFFPPFLIHNYNNDNIPAVTSCISTSHHPAMVHNITAAHIFCGNPLGQQWLVPDSLLANRSPLQQPLTKSFSPSTKQAAPPVTSAASKQQLFRPWDDETTQNNALTEKSCFKTTDNQNDLSSAIESSPKAAVSAEEKSIALEVLVTSLGRSVCGHRCLFCGKVYSRKYGLKIHLRTHTGFKPLKCPVCNRQFSDPSNLNKHSRLHSQETRFFSCDLCGKRLARKRDLDKHIQQKHFECVVDIETL